MEQMHISAEGKEKLYVQAFREIRAYIIRNELKPGELLPSEQTLCESLGVSRNVLREAIKSMEMMGLVEACPGRGTAVKTLNLDFIFQNVMFYTVGKDEEKAIREMLSLRRTLELDFAPQVFFTMTPEDIAHLKGCVEQIRERWAHNEIFSDIDKEFHMTLYRPLNNGVLNSLLSAVWAVDDVFQLEQKVPHLGLTIAKHAAIVEALEEKNYDMFMRAMQAHFSSGKYMSRNSYEEY